MAPMEDPPVEQVTIARPQLQQVATVQRASAGPSGTEYIQVTGSESSNEIGKLFYYWNVLARRKFTLALLAMAGLAAGFAAAVKQTPTYVTSTLLEFSHAQRQPFQGISYLTEGDSLMLQTQAQLLTSGTLQARVKAKLPDEVPSAALQAPGPLASTRAWLGLSKATGEAAWREAIGAAGGAITVTPIKDTRLLRITAQSTLPQAAADYANTLAQEFIAKNQEDRWALYQTTGEWLDRAQQELKTKLEESERQLLTYASAAGLVVTSNADSVNEQKLMEVQSELSKAQADRIAKESVYRTASSQPPDSPVMLERGPMAAHELQLSDLRRQLADATTALTTEHPKVKRIQAQIEEVQAAQSRERTNVLGRLRGDYDVARRREQQLIAAFESESKLLSQQDQKLIRYKMLQREVDTYRKIYETTLQAGREASVASALHPVTARVVDPAYVPRGPSRPKLLGNLTSGLAVGVLLGVALALIRERSDASIRTPGSVALQVNLRELGVIPSATSDSEWALDGAPRRLIFPAVAADASTVNLNARQVVELATWNRKGSLLAESFRAALTSILMSGQNGDRKQIILVTSPSPREGKTTVVTNLAIALAEIRQRVVLIDADLRRPRLHSIFGQANTWGLSDVLLENTACAEYPIEALARQTHVPGLFTIPSGSNHDHVSPLLHSERLPQLLKRLRQEFDSILIDTPPVLSVADARILSRLVDAVVLVVRAGQTTIEAAALAANVFEADGVPVFGTILNDWNPRTMGHGYYSEEYGHRYSYDMDSPSAGTNAI